MKDLLELEWKKTTKSFYFYSMIVFLLLFVSVYFIYSSINTWRVDDYINGHIEIIQSFEAEIEELKASGLDEEQIADEIEFNMAFIETHSRLIEAAEREDWQTIIEHYLGFAEDYVRTMPSQKEEDVYTYPTHFSHEAEYAKLSWMLERDVRPIFPVSGEPTAYDRAYREDIDKEVADYMYNRPDTSSIYFLYLLLRWTLGVGAVIFFLFLFGNMMTREGLDRSLSGPLNLLDTQPIRRGKIMLSKLITLLGITFIILVGTVLFGGLLGLVFDRFGDWDYPVLIYEPDFSLHLIKMGDYILLSLLLFFGVMIFSYSWLLFYSVLVKRTFTAITLTVFTLVVGMALSGSDVAMESAFVPYNPFNYFQVNAIITMEKALVADNFDITMTNGMLSLGIFSFLLLIVSFIIFRRRAV